MPARLLELAPQPRTAEVGHADLDHMLALLPILAPDRPAAPGVGGAIGAKKGRALLRRKMAELEDGAEMARRHRRRIRRVGDLRDEALVLAERQRDLLARARRPAIDVGLEQ